MFNTISSEEANRYARTAEIHRARTFLDVRGVLNTGAISTIYAWIEARAKVGEQTLLAKFDDIDVLNFVQARLIKNGFDAPSTENNELDIYW